MTSSLAGVRTVRGEPAFTYAVSVTFLVARRVTPVVEILYSPDDVDQENVACISVQQY
jgi:hypothetical protein